MFVMGRYEDGIAIARQAVQIDSSIGGRFRIAKSLANTGLCYAGAGEYQRGLDFLHQAREAHERYGERDSRADTLLALSEVLLEKGDVDQARGYVGDAAALIQVTESRYDATHERLLRALLAYAVGDNREAVQRASEARRAAETQAYASFQFYAMALEAAGRVEIGELHTGILLATTAIGAVEALQGSEYSLEVRALCCQALDKAGSPQAAEMRRRASKHAQATADRLRDPHLWQSFMNRPPVRLVLGERREPSPSELQSLGAPL
jgi:tetratricopeptide (TPR) repeat protein